MPTWRHAAWASALVIISLTLQGCELLDDYQPDEHFVGNWRKEPDYLLNFEFISPGGSAKDARLNSCSLDRLAQGLQCSGRGVCEMWDSNDMANQISFCKCDRDYADPECQTKRASQTTAYVLSLFFGYLGADHFYLGLWMTGSLKLVTLGGAGLWWAVDIIRTGSGPIEADMYRTANDLGHFTFIIVTVAFALCVGFAYAMVDSQKTMLARKKLALMSHDQEDDSTTMFGMHFANAFERKKKTEDPDAYEEKHGHDENVSHFFAKKNQNIFDDGRMVPYATFERDFLKQMNEQRAVI